MASAERLVGQALVGEKGGDFALREVVTQPMGDNDVAIRTVWSGVSIGTEFAVLTGKLDWGPFPIVTGYMATGVVSELGRDVQGLSAGDHVYYAGNPQLEVRETGTKLNCRSGGHASVAVLPAAGVSPVPPGVGLDAASLWVMPAVGLYGVDLAGVGVGAHVVVIGLGMVGLGVVSAANRRGASVTGIDPRKACRDLATELGAAEVLSTADGRTTDVIETVVARTGGEGADFVFESTGRPECVDAGIQMCRPFGCFVWQGNYGDGQVSFEFLEAHHRRLRMSFPCSWGGADYAEASLRAIADGSMPWSKVITHRLAFEDMPGFYSDIFHGRGSDVIGAVIHWSDVA